MFNTNVFGSGSLGNCIYVDTGDCKLLLDAGLSFKDIKLGLKGVGARLSDIDYILITHSHGDHIKGLKNIVDKYNTKVITTAGEALTLKCSTATIDTIAYNETIKLCNTEVTAYKLPHDTNEPVYFSIKNSIGEKLLYLTDCGTDIGIEPNDHDVFIIEANYYMDGILDSLKTKKIHAVQFSRTTSDTGHLDVRQTIEILKRCVGERAKHIILSHLSSSNGNGQLFKEMVQDALNFENVYIAEKGLCVNCGENPNIF